jgi:hypothetical protein
LVVEGLAKTDEELPVGPVYVTAGANEEVANETTDETCEMETFAPVTEPITLSKEIAR